MDPEIFQLGEHDKSAVLAPQLSNSSGAGGLLHEAGFEVFKTRHEI